jgi:hypothetical protein
MARPAPSSFRIMAGSTMAQQLGYAADGYCGWKICRYRVILYLLSFCILKSISPSRFVLGRRNQGCMRVHPKLLFAVSACPAPLIRSFSSFRSIEGVMTGTSASAEHTTLPRHAQWHVDQSGTSPPKSIRLRTKDQSLAIKVVAF